MRGLGYKNGDITKFGQMWHCGCLMSTRYKVGSFVAFFIGDRPDPEPWVCRWLGLSGFDHLSE